MTETRTTVEIINYPGAMQSAVHGLRELFVLASRMCAAESLPQSFDVLLLDAGRLKRPARGKRMPRRSARRVVIVPPNMDGVYYREPSRELKALLAERHSEGALVCSVCAGAFILGAAGLLRGRTATTHWMLSAEFARAYPAVRLDIDRILVNDGEIITCGGMMAWVDLGLELVARFCGPGLMRRLGKVLLVDTAPREQNYYRSFLPKLDHGDKEILKAQHHIQAGFGGALSVKALAALCFMGERTFLRRFTKATGFTPAKYVQEIRMQKACELLESTNEPVENISIRAGYEDLSAFRRLFIRSMGLTPRDFRRKFSAVGSNAACLGS
jgi:transcriptional regulator GlxA family with amidase domain